MIWFAFHVAHLAENNIFLLKKFQCGLILGWRHVVTFLIINRCIIIIFIITVSVGEESAQNPCVSRVPWQLPNIHIIRGIWFLTWILLVMAVLTIWWNFFVIIFVFFLLIFLRFLLYGVIEVENDFFILF